MSSYKYEALDSEGNPVGGEVEANNQSGAVERVQSMGYTPVKIQKIRESSLKKLLEFDKGVSMGELGLFTRQMASMLNAGIPIIRALHALGEQSSNPTLRKALKQIASSVEGGSDLSEAMRNHPQVFSTMYVDMIKAGEIGGNMVSVLNRLAEQIDKDKSLRDNIKSATVYPVGVVIFATIILLAMMFFIVPVFVDMFPDDAQLPVLTSIIIGVSDSLRELWYIYFLIIIILGYTTRQYLSSEPGRRVWDKVRFRLPVFGSLLQKTVVARFSRTLSTLLSGGIPILEALDTAGPTSGSIRLNETVQEAANRVQEGENLASPLKKNPLFPPMVTMMISIGEETGELPELLNRIADFYEMEVDTMTKGLTSLIEPILIVIVGGLVAVMVISLYLPLFTVITQMG